LEGLQPVPAQKVLRENVQHNMLVGDQEMTSQQVTDVLNRVESKRAWFMVLGWIVFILAVIAIIILLYMKKFQTTSTGLQLRW
jgi:predicted nucleic acid-binding Zn ribbon protein